MPQATSTTDHLLRWVEQKQKAARRGMRLEEEIVITQEYSARTHSSAYALVSFHCYPADALAVEYLADWPVEISQSEVEILQNAIEVAIVDTLFCNAKPFSKCALRLKIVRYDAVRSSQVAFYNATTQAMERLIGEGRWGCV